ncbi:hypothetical protein BC938DRAFT_484066 [Jimgerdemannia flammicorona]|uniref:Uncharacterized protein n=1 Tax=Jimgerdemannia flammicorona TaxID=994334 RepID=A0A433QAK5_9FUNG|nr:hypothetical protein BC938DRAFT_484066 [Jimgerdemannia flammicorona]
MRHEPIYIGGEVFPSQPLPQILAGVQPNTLSRCQRTASNGKLCVRVHRRASQGDILVRWWVLEVDFGCA